MDRDPSPNVPPTEAESPLPTSAVTAIRGDRWSFDAILVAGTYRSEMQSKSNRWELALLALFGTVVASFLSATAYSQYRAAAIDERARQIAEEVSPAIERLAAVRADVRRLQASVANYARVPTSDALDALQTVKASIQALNEDEQRYVGLRIYGRDRELWNRTIEPKLGDFRHAVHRTVDSIQFGEAEAARLESTRDLTRIADEVGSALLQGQDLNASIAHDLAVRIADTREHSAAIGWILDLLCTLTAAVGAFVVVRVHRRQAMLAHAHSQLLEERNEQLEEFAGRVAHDILSPLSSISMMLSTLENAKRSLSDRPALGGMIARGARSLSRIQTVVDGLLEFARAGAHPIGGARSDVKRAIEDVVQTLASSAEQNLITLDAAPVPACAVACNPGVLTSLISNLAENAIKYMGDSPARRVTVRVLDRGPTVRVEVEDTGPGIPSELAPKIFSPYVRGTPGKQPGIGLGLATVKRMAEAHGGEVGVESALDHGSTFWFELPSVTALTSENADTVGHAVGGPVRSGISV